MRQKVRALSLIIIFLLLVYHAVNGQIRYPGEPTFFQSQKSIPFLKLEDAVVAPDRQSLKESGDGSFYKVSQFAKVQRLDIPLFEAGNWSVGKNGVSVCRLGLYAPGASSLNISLSGFFLYPGIKIYVFSPNRQTVHGAFTFRNNKPGGILPVSPVPGDSLIIEMHVWANTAIPQSLHIARAGIGYRQNDTQKSTQDEWFQRSAPCEMDINCVNDEYIQRQKQSVVRIIFDNSKRCTGTLINNTGKDSKPYVLTAAHCIQTEEQASGAVFFFDYESPYCAGPDGDIKSVSGSALLAEGGNLVDFSLVELSEVPPLDYQPVYSGWDRRDIPDGFHYLIHHPEGDVKKFTSDEDMLETNTFNGYIQESHWLVPDYENGSSEFGSSGGPLFDENNRLIGTLTAGGAVCSEYIYDYYQKFSTAWDVFPEPERQLKTWLDPSGSGASFSDNYYPYDIRFDYAQVLSNVDEGELTFSPGLSAGWGFISGHSGQGKVEFAEHFSVRGSKYIYAVEIEPGHITVAKPSSKLDLVIRDLDTPGNDILFSKEVFLFELEAEIKNLIRLDTLILVDRNFSVGYRINYDPPQDTLAINLVTGNPERLKNTAYTFQDNTWLKLNSGEADLNTSLAIDLYVFDFYASENIDDLANFPDEKVTLYPNPSYDKIQILLKDQPLGLVRVTVYDAFGRLVQVLTVEDPERNFRVSTEFMGPGMYFMRIEYNSESVVKKFVKI